MILYLSQVNGRVICHHVAVAGLSSASFEGGRKCGGARRRLLEFSIELN